MTAPRLSELLPCPFCGGEASVARVYEYGGITYGVECNCFKDANAAFDTSATREIAIAAWNRRAAVRQDAVSRADAALYEAVRAWVTTADCGSTRAGLIEAWEACRAARAARSPEREADEDERPDLADDIGVDLLVLLREGHSHEDFCHKATDIVRAALRRAGEERS